MVKLYIKDIREPLPFGIEKELPQSRVERAMKYKKEEGRNRCLYAGVLLSEFLNVHSDEDIIYNAYGKPFLRNGSMYFNLSHSGNYVVLAVSEYPVGVDIERIKEYNKGVARRCFTEEELNYIKEKEQEDEGLADNKSKVFYKLWTAKEAVMKADGRGFNINPSEFDVLPIKNGCHYITDSLYHLSWSEINEYIICLAVQGKEDIKVLSNDINSEGKENRFKC